MKRLELLARVAELEAALAAEREALAALGRSFDKERGQRQKADAALADRDRMLELAVEDSLPNFSWDDMEDRSLMASRLADLRNRSEKGSGT